MADQESTAENKLGQNWRTVAIVAAILMVGAVMGHSVLSGDRGISAKGGENSACSTCPASGSCSEMAATDAAGACCAGKSEAGCSAQQGACAATTGACSEGTGCSDAQTATETPAGCGGCPFSTGAKTE